MSEPKTAVASTEQSKTVKEEAQGNSGKGSAENPAPDDQKLDAMSLEVMAKAAALLSSIFKGIKATLDENALDKNKGQLSTRDGRGGNSR